MAKRVLVLNHFAVPEGSAGGTRHVEMFTRLGDGWEAEIIAADRNLFDPSHAHRSGRGFRTVRTTPYGSNGPARILNWVSYAVGALFVGLRSRRPDVVYASSPHLLAGLVPAPRGGLPQGRPRPGVLRHQRHAATVAHRHRHRTV